MAHEINNPLNVILNYGQILLDSPTDVERVVECGHSIVKEGDRVATIVRNLLSFARQDKEAFSLARLADIVEKTLSLTHAVLRKDQIVLECEIPADLPPVTCRSQQLQQVLMNLITNARDALAERHPRATGDKVLRIAGSSIVRDGERYARLTVEDHGCGIPPDIASRIFDPFYTTKARDKGTGLGLSISYGIIREHGGDISFESEPGKGTRFHVDLPLDRPPPAPDMESR